MGSRIRFHAMRLYALVGAAAAEAIDVFVSEEDARRALKGCLRDAGWRGLLGVQEIEFSSTSECAK